MLDAEGPLLSKIYMLRSQDQYLLITDRPSTRPQAGRSISPAPGGFNNPLVTGRIYAFDRRTGKPQWSVPATVEQQGLMLSQPSDLPVLVFVRHILETSAGTRTPRTSVLCLDKRTGRLLFEKGDFPFRADFFSLTADRAHNQVILSLPSKEITLTFTDKPEAPEPPDQVESDEVARGQSSGIFRILGAIPKYIGKAAGDPFDNGSDADIEDLFGEPADDTPEEESQE
jgi:hypothetical protein